MADKEEKSSRYTLMKILSGVDSALEKSNRIFESVAKFQQNPTPAGVFHLGTELGRTALGLKALNKYKPNNWPRFFPGDDHFSTLKEILMAFPFSSLGNNKEDLVTFYDFYGKTVATDSSGISAFRYVKEETNSDELYELFSKAVWEQHGSPLALRTKVIVGEGYSSTNLEYAPAYTLDYKRSNMCDDLSARLKKFLDKGISRSVMFHGPPGTGKTTLINTIADSFCGKVLVVDVSDLGYISSSTLAKRVIWLQPDALIINDLDRVLGGDQLLSTVEHLCKNIKLLMVSVNSRESLPTALKRPGRFDEMFEVTHLDEAAVEKIICLDRSRIPDNVWDEVKMWPAAFIVELGKIVECLGEENLVEEFTKLQERVKENFPDDKDEDEEEDEEDSKNLLVTWSDKDD